LEDIIKHTSETKSASISMTIQNMLTTYSIHLKHQSNITADRVKFSHHEKPRWRWPPYWISGNVHTSALDEDICTKFGRRMHIGHMNMTTWTKLM